MEHVAIPGIGFPVSRIALGTWAIGSWMWGGGAEIEAVRTIHAALDLGVNLLDTSPAYGGGRAEELVGAALASRRGTPVAIASKVALDAGGGPIPAAGLVRSVEGSLARLRVEVLDLCQVEGLSPATPIEETGRALGELVRAGKVRAIGVTELGAEEAERLHAVTPVATAQLPYNFFEREAEGDLLPWCGRRGVAALACGALCKGLLSGKLSPELTFEGDALRETDPKFRSPRYHGYLAAVAALDAFAREAFGRTVLELAVRWLLDRPGVAAALWGARRPAQLEPLPRVLGWRLGPEAMARIDEIVRAHVDGPPGGEARTSHV